MWFATRDGLNRYDGNTFVTYKHDPNDPGSLSSNYVRDLLEDDRGHLWVATHFGGVNRFDPKAERFTVYRHDGNNANSIGGDAVESIARDTRGCLWFGTTEDGLDRFDPATGTFTHFLNDGDGAFVGRITDVLEDSRGEIWFVGQRGLFHLNPSTGRIERYGAAIALAADHLHDDGVGHLWMLAFSPIVGLVKYERETGRFTQYPFGNGAVGVASSNLLADGESGFWVASSQGLQYFDRRTERYTYKFRHDQASPDSLDDDIVVTVYRDKAGLLWVGTEKGGLNLLDWRQQQFGLYRHRPGDPNSLSPGKVTAIYQEPSGIVWVGFFPRALDRVDPRTGRVVHYVPGDGKNGLGAGGEVNGIYKDARGHLWLSGWAAGLDRLDERTGQFTYYRYSPRNSNGLMSDNVFALYGDRAGQLWIGQANGLSRLDPVTGQFTHYPPDPPTPTNRRKSAQAFYEDRSGTLWVARGSVVSRFDDGTKSFVNYAPDPRDPGKPSSGSVTAIHEDKAGTLWFGAWDGLYRYDRPHGTFARYTESSGLPSSAIQGILEDDAGRLWLPTLKGISRFDPRTQTFKNYDASDGLQGDDFSRAYFRGPTGQMFFGGSNGLNAFFAKAIRDDPYVPPIVITSFKVFNRPVSIGSASVLKSAIPYAESLTLSHRDNIFSLEFAALSYSNAHKNRYRYRLEGLEPGWNEVGSKQRLASYTNLDPGSYVFHVQGSNHHGVWNEEGVSLPILITPPWWRSRWFLGLCAGGCLAMLWAVYRLRIRQMHHAFELTLEARVGERIRIARELHDTLLQSFHGVLLQFQTASHLLPERPAEAKAKLDGAIRHAAKAVTEGRDAVQDLRAGVAERGNLAVAIRTLGDELATEADTDQRPTFRVALEGQPRDLRPMLRDEIYRIAAEALRNAFRHAHAGRVEVELRYDDKELRLRVRDDGRGIDPAVLASKGMAGHYGLRGMPERAALMAGKLAVWSEVGAGTEVELRVPARTIYATSHGGSWWSRRASRDAGTNKGDVA